MVTIIIVNIIACLLAYLAKDRKNRICLALAFILLSVVLGVRYNYGNDYFNYYASYISNCTSAWNQESEIGWYILNRICEPIGFMGFIFIITCITNYLVYRIIVKYVPQRWYWFAVFIFCFTANFMVLGTSMIRQYVTMVLCLFAVSNIIERNFISFFITVAIAYSIHSISFVLVPLIIFVLPEKLYKNNAFYLLLILLFLFSWLNIDKLFISFAELLLEYESDYSVYLGWEEGRLGYRKIIVMITMFVLFLRHKQKLNGAELTFGLVVVVSYIISPLSIIIQILSRLTLMFSICQVVHYPQLISHEKSVLKYVILLLFMFATLLDFRAFFLSDTYHDAFYHYHTVFSAPEFI